MAVRASMADLINFVRDLIGDPAGPDERYSDQQIQDRLDLQRKTLSMSPLCATKTLTPTNEYEYKHFESGWDFWESSAVIQVRNTGEVLTPDAPNYLGGDFDFDESVSEDLVISGRVYNVYGVASNMIIMWANDFKTQIMSWTADGTTIQRINSIRSMQMTGAELAKLAWGWGGTGSQVRLVRKDIRN
jgi:hypothetical protein